jgi:PIN domain nuclease of toxin-antitoxin system
MKFLLDTHTLLWWFAGDSKLPPFAQTVIADEENHIFVSAVSAWEISTKVRIGKLDGAREIASDLEVHIARQSFQPLDISMFHARQAGALPGPHRDPFDRMLIAQSRAEALPIISNDKVFDTYKVERVWSSPSPSS